MKVEKRSWNLICDLHLSAHQTMIPQFKQYLQLSSFLRPQVGQILLISSSLATEKTE